MLCYSYFSEVRTPTDRHVDFAEHFTRFDINYGRSEGELFWGGGDGCSAAKLCRFPQWLVQEEDEDTLVLWGSLGLLGSQSHVEYSECPTVVVLVASDEDDEDNDDDDKPQNVSRPIHQSLSLPCAPSTLSAPSLHWVACHFKSNSNFTSLSNQGGHSLHLCVTFVMMMIRKELRCLFGNQFKHLLQRGMREEMNSWNKN